MSVYVCVCMCVCVCVRVFATLLIVTIINRSVLFYECWICVSLNEKSLKLYKNKPL